MCIYYAWKENTAVLSHTEKNAILVVLTALLHVQWWWKDPMYCENQKLHILGLFD